MFEDIADMTININRILVAYWLYDRLRVKYRNGYGVEIKGEAAYELWQKLRSRYTILSETCVINTNAIIIIRWLNDYQQAEVKLDNATVENFSGLEARELRRVLRAIQSESKE